MGTLKDLKVYNKAFAVAMEVFEISKSFPSEEKYALTSQIRRSSRAICANLAEGYRKRLYPAHFISKISDADMENAETIVWLDFALNCGYITDIKYKELVDSTAEIGRLLGDMIRFPEKYAPKGMQA